MVKVLFINASGEIEQIIDPSDPANYPNLTYDDNGYYIIHVDIMTDVATLMSTSFWDFDLNTWVQRDVRPSNNHFWGNKQWTLNNDMLWTEIRQQRDNRLRNTDWTQLGDVPPGRAAKWATYRQSLRDLPANQPDVNYASEIVWPDEPF